MNGTTITCVPMGLCSWDYSFTGGGHTGSAIFNWAQESGSLNIEGKAYQIEKPSLLQGLWELKRSNRVILRAEKQDVFSRTFQINNGKRDRALHLEAESPFGRTMRLTGPGVNCIYEPAHAFTRRATIQGRWREFEPVTFGFWLSGLMWRRAANQNAT